MADEKNIHNDNITSEDNGGKKNKKKHKKNKKSDKKNYGDVVVIADKGPSKTPIIFAVIMVIVLTAIVAVSVHIVKTHPADSSVQLPLSRTTAPQTAPTAAQQTLPTTTEKPRIIPDGEAAILISGNFSLDGTVYTSGESGGYSVNMYSSPDASYVSGLCSGMWLGVLQNKDGKYLIDNESETYIEVTDDAKDEIYTRLGVKAIPYDVRLPGDISDAEFQRVDVELNGEKAVCYTASGADSSVEIYTVDGELKQFIVYGSDSYPAYEVIVKEISSQVPHGQLTTYGLAKSTSLFSFFSAISQ